MKRKKRFALPLAAALLLALVGCGSQTLTPSEPSGGGEISGDAAPAQTEDFALRSAAQLLDPTENSCYSPVSLYLALSMAGTGAAGETQGQIYDVLGAANTQQQIASCAALMEDLTRDGEETALYFANSVWTRAGLPMEQSYLDGLETGFGAEHFSVDFSKQDTNEKMTRWVSRQTRPGGCWNRNFPTAAILWRYCSTPFILRTAGANRSLNRPPKRGLLPLPGAKPVRCPLCT